MILELVDLTIHAGKQEEFTLAIQKGLNDVISKARGYVGHQINHCIETPDRWVLLIYWETLENHTVDFRGSPAFADWRVIVGPYFAKPPHVEHFSLIQKTH